MRLSECPSYGIALYKDGEIAFLKPHPGPDAVFNCRVSFYPDNGGLWGTRIGIGYISTACKRDNDPIERFWALSPEEVESIEKLLREKLGL